MEKEAQTGRKSVWSSECLLQDTIVRRIVSSSCHSLSILDIVYSVPNNVLARKSDKVSFTSCFEILNSHLATLLKDFLIAILRHKGLL